MGFRVIIVGAGLTGLVTALAMEQLGIDFLLLEAHETIGPRIGGAIILQPGGLRILDQLGCYEAIMRQERGCWLHKGVLVSESGKPLIPPAYTHHHIYQRLGYPSIQIRRDVLLRTLAGTIRHKDRLLVGVKFKRIETDEDGVRVYGADGSCYSGHIVVGADGVHSAVRTEMWRLKSLSSAPPSSSESADLSRYRVHSRALVCISATPRTADGKEGLVEYHVMKDGIVLLTDTPDNRTVMFILQKLPLANAAAGSSIRFGAEEEAALVKDYANMPIHGGDFTVRDLYSRRLGPPSLIVVNDYLAQTWSFDRLLLLGDSACKSTPYAGMNSSVAIESTAYFANSLFNSLHQKSRESLSRVQVAETFSQFRRDSRTRINFVFSLASWEEDLLFKSNALSKYLPLHLVTPRIGATLNADLFVFCSSGAPRIKGLPMPPRPRFTPFDDELPAKPVQSNWLLWVPRILVAFLMTALLLSACCPGLTIVPPGLLPAGGLVSPEVAFVVNLFPVITAWLAESRRFGTSDPLGCVCLYGLLYLRLGPASITPLFGLSSLLLSRKTIDGRRMPPAAAKAILPSVCLGYALPTLAALLPMGHGRSLARTIAAAWHASPFISALLLALLGRHRCPPECVQASEVPVGKSHSPERKVIGLSEAQIEERYRLLDVGFVKLAHAAGFVLCSASAIFFSLGSLPSSSTSPQSFADMSSVPLALIANDIQERGLRIQFVSIAVYSLYMLWTLRASGFVATKSSVVILLRAVAILMALGPGAMLSASLWWHEHAISRLSEPVPRNLLDETEEEDCITPRP